MRASLRRRTPRLPASRACATAGISARNVAGLRPHDQGDGAGAPRVHGILLRRQARKCRLHRRIRATRIEHLGQGRGSHSDQRHPRNEGGCRVAQGERPWLRRRHRRVSAASLDQPKRTTLATERRRGRASASWTWWRFAIARSGRSTVVRALRGLRGSSGSPTRAGPGTDDGTSRA